MEELRVQMCGKDLPRLVLFLLSVRCLLDVQVVLLGGLWLYRLGAKRITLYCRCAEKLLSDQIAQDLHVNRK